MNASDENLLSKPASEPAPKPDLEPNAAGGVVGKRKWRSPLPVVRGTDEPRPKELVERLNAWPGMVDNLDLDGL